MNDLEKKTYIFGTIFTLSNKLQLLGDKMDKELTVKQWLFLAGVLKCANDAPTITEIATQIGSSRQNIKKIALILEKQGFITMKKDSIDARMLRISLTKTCKLYLKKRETMELQFIKKLFDSFELNELSSLAATITKLEKNIKNMSSKYNGMEF